MKNRLFIAADWIAFVGVPIILWLISISWGGHMYKEWGSRSLNILYVILFMKPIIVILGYRELYQLLPYRRQLWMLAFWFGLFHTWWLIIQKDLWNLSAYMTNPASNYLFHGAIAIIGMFFLALTSNFWSIKKLGKNWKRLQRLAYPVLFLSKLHADLSHGMGRAMRFPQSTASASLSNGNAASIATNTISYSRYVPTLILLIVFVWLKFRQHQVEKKKWKSLHELLEVQQ